MKKIEMTIASASGTELLLESEIESEVRNDEINMDGFVFEGKKKLFENSYYIIKKDGKVVSRGDLKNTVCWPRETTYKGYTGFVFGQALISKESFEAIKGAYEEALAEEHSKPDVKEFIEKQESEEKKKKLSRAKNIIETAEKQAQIPTRAELKTIQKKWNNIYNEGCEGYVPTMITKEEYNVAIETLKKLQAE